MLADLIRFDLDYIKEHIELFDDIKSDKKTLEEFFRILSLGITEFTLEQNLYFVNIDITINHDKPESIEHLIDNINEFRTTFLDNNRLTDTNLVKEFSRYERKSKEIQKAQEKNNKRLSEIKSIFGIQEPTEESDWYWAINKPANKQTLSISDILELDNTTEISNSEEQPINNIDPETTKQQINPIVENSSEVYNGKQSFDLNNFYSKNKISLILITFFLFLTIFTQKL